MLCYVMFIISCYNSEKMVKNCFAEVIAQLVHDKPTRLD